MAFTTPPKPAGERRRRNVPQANTAKLPAEGRKGLTPIWPLEGQTKQEKALWKELWHTPQATMWEKMSWYRMVARYVRLCLRAEAYDAPLTSLSEVLRYEDALGLTPMALLKLRWEIEDLPEGKSVSLVPFQPRVRAIDASA